MKAEWTRHDGSIRSGMMTSPIRVANDSLSQRLSHHSIVTTLPNHWWATSCDWIETTSFFAFNPDFLGSQRYAVVWPMMRPQFSMACLPRE